MSEPVLKADGIEKRFGAFRALKSVDFELQAGEVRALLGVNGAGKSTFVKIISGLYARDSGALTVAGNRVEIGSPAAALNVGIASVQQHPELVEDISGFENIYLGKEATGALYSRAKLRQRALSLAHRYEIDVDLDTPVGELSAIEREMIAILRAISADDIKVLILDEPTSVLTQREKAILFSLIARLSQRGIGVIYITHRLDEVFEIASSFTVFRGGEVVATQPVTAETDARSIAELMLGTSLGNVYPDKHPQPREPVLEARKLDVVGNFENVSFTARKGEVLGIFGLLGSGLDELSKAIFGALAPTGGELAVNGGAVTFTSPRDALRAGIFLVPGDRRKEGLTPERDVAFNTTLARLDNVSLGGLVNFGSARRRSAELARKVDLQPYDTYRKAESFSGGNQQKIVIAKGLFTQADCYVFVEPTVGVDIGARSKIYSLIRELASHAAVIVMSSDAEEAYGLSDHVIALLAGKIVRSGPVASLTREELLLAGLGAPREKARVA